MSLRIEDGGLIQGVALVVVDPFHGVAGGFQACLGSGAKTFYSRIIQDCYSRRGFFYWSGRLNCF